MGLVWSVSSPAFVYLPGLNPPPWDLACFLRNWYSTAFGERRRYTVEYTRAQNHTVAFSTGRMEVVSGTWWSDIELASRNFFVFSSKFYHGNPCLGISRCDAQSLGMSNDVYHANLVWASESRIRRVWSLAADWICLAAVRQQHHRPHPLPHPGEFDPTLRLDTPTTGIRRWRTYECCVSEKGHACMRTCGCRREMVGGVRRVEGWGIKRERMCVWEREEVGESEKNLTSQPVRPSRWLTMIPTNTMDARMCGRWEG